MDVRPDPAVDNLAPERLGQIQRRPLPDIALNIDRHQPPLQHAGLDRRPPDRDRDERLRELRREMREQERHRRQRVQTVLSNSSQFPYTTIRVLVLVMSVISLKLVISVLYSSITFLIVPDKYNQSAVHSNPTYTYQVKLFRAMRLVKFNAYIYTMYLITYGFWSMARMLLLSKIFKKFYTGQPVKDSTQVAHYRCMSLGSYAAALLMAVSCGHVSYRLSHAITNLITLSANSTYILVLYYLSRGQMVVSCLVEWLIGCVLYRLEHKLRPQVTTFPWIAIISGIATMIVNVCMLMTCLRMNVINSFA